MLRRVLYGLVLAVLIFRPSAAQEVPKAEVFGGYAYGGQGTRGWNASVAGNLNSWFGLVADFGGQYTRLEEPDASERIKTHSFLFGPQVSVRSHKRVTPFARALFGTSTIRTHAVESGQSFSFSDMRFAMALGGGLDVRLNDRVALRAVQIDYLRTRFFDEVQNKGRLSFGLVFRFGRK
jgi:opacity protein-like surface antigen